MTDFQNIYNDFFEIDANNYMEIIRFYENNSLFLDNKSTFLNRDDFNDYVLVVAQFVISLENLGKYSKANKYSNKLLALIDNNVNKYGIKLIDFTPYWSILTSKGRALYYLKDYKNSAQIFDKLLIWDSDNDNFKNWRDSANRKKRNSINNYLYIIAGILLVSEIFLGEFFKIPKVRIYMSGFGFLLISIALFNDFLSKKNFKSGKIEK